VAVMLLRKGSLCGEWDLRRRESHE
jgi:hypothetical protein